MNAIGSPVLFFLPPLIPLRLDKRINTIGHNQIKPLDPIHRTPDL